MKMLTFILKALGTAVIFVLAPCAQAADVTAIMTSGDVRFVNAAGQERPATRGGELRPGERVETGTTGRVQLRFSDGALVSLQPDTTFRVDEYRYSGKEDGAEKVALSLIKGAFRTVTGFIGRSNKANYTVYTTTATIGIRGTSYLASLNGSQLRVTVGIGRVALTSLGGTLEVGAGQTGFVPSANASPQIVSVQPSLPPAPATATAEEVKKSEERTATGAPTTITDTENRITSLYTSAVTGGTTSTSTTQSAAGGAVSGAVSTAIGAGPYAIAYAAGINVGIDSRTPVTATFGARGALSGYTWTTNTVESPTVGTNVVADVSGDQFVTLGRWNGGTTAGGFYSSTTGFSYSGNQGFHYALGIPAVSLPTSGTATYAMLGATSPTVRDGSRSPGTATGALAVLWAGPSTKVGVQLKITIPNDATYEVLTSGGTANPAGSELSAFDTSMFTGGSVTTVGNGQSCSGSCTSIIQGFFAGPTQERAALAYTINSGTSAKNVDGTMSFQPGAITVASTLTPVTGSSVGPLAGAPDRILTVAPGSVADFGPGFFTRAAFDTSNGLQSFTTFVNTQSAGSASVANAGSDSIIAWGRWTNGLPVNSGVTTALNSNQGVHYVLGLPTITLPASGTATYSLLGATPATHNGGTIAPGTFAGSLNVSFAGTATRIGIDATVTMGASVFAMRSTGGLTSPASSQIGVRSGSTGAAQTMWAGTSGGVVQVPVTGGGCLTSCSATMLGSFFGTNADRAGIIYSIGGTPLGDNITGAATFTKGGAI